MKISDFSLLCRAECAYQLSIIEDVPFEKICKHCDITEKEFSMYLLGIWHMRLKYERING